MVHAEVDARNQPQYAATDVVDVTHGWYFYGITERGSLAPSLLASFGASKNDRPSVLGDESPLQLVELFGLAAVVRRVLLDDFRPTAFRDRLHNDNGLEALVRCHNDVVEAIHARQPILPSKLGVVYANADDILCALRPAHDALLRRLHRLQGCDEWAIHLYADEERIRGRVADAEPAVNKLRNELALARPGRAYFLEQQLRDELRAATEQALLTHAERTFDRLSSFSVDALASPTKPRTDATEHLEILRASFLVPRDIIQQFETEVQLCCDDSEGLRCEYTGPWPAYSFAAQEDGETV